MQRWQKVIKNSYASLMSFFTTFDGRLSSNSGKVGPHFFTKNN
ncbi:hypothetical protein M23134_04925 [Microscilla marina ATCC 23134]|uniref:Uncharacterized protein n=1 Tax=Microscilla marina ATCC 23134 TaxID=313606 RepID=A1ZV95_MICM2|nr:hypothetical protein M23134_04925 [Microscilla marina ATCC 23134]